jgi:hypothetical protein
MNNVLEPDWSLGTCRSPNVGFSNFFEDFERGTIEEKKLILGYCRGCPIKKKCKDWAIANECNGLWGGEYLDADGRILKRPLQRSYLEDQRDIAARKKFLQTSVDSTAVA